MKSHTLKSTLKAAALAAAIGSLSLSYTSQAGPILEGFAAQGQVPTLAPMIKKVLPSVVNISVKGKKNVTTQMFPFPDEFKFMFPELDNQRQRSREFRALGSGVIVDADKGLVITNHHVVDSADEIRVATYDGREFTATKVGSDQHTDLAVLKLEEFSSLQALNLADSDKLEVGDFAVAIGNPFGLGQTVTSGIISALGRSGLNIENIENFIQTDAAINSGNSGGALVNLQGELIGINTAILGPNGGNIGIGFAIPSNMVRTVMDQLVNFGEVKRGLLGIMGTELNSDLAKNFGYERSGGAFVNEVLKGGAAEKAGVQPGDIITSVNGKQVTSFGQMRANIATQRPGTVVTLGIFRDGKDLEIKVKLADDEQISLNAKDSSTLTEGFEGATLANSDDGVLVKDVAQNSKAQSIGLKSGDVITGVNRATVRNIEQLKKELNKTKGRITALRIQRGDTRIFITLR